MGDTIKPRLFDLWLPTFSLEGGGNLRRHILRGWWWGPSADEGWLESRSVPVRESECYRVVQRSKEDLSLLREAQERLDKGSRLGPPTETPTVVVVHALTGDMHVGGRGGWWSTLVGEGAVLNPSKVRVLCFNNLGSCYGSSGPTDWGTGEDGKPLCLTTWDQARSILLGLDKLGVGTVHLVVGGSIGGGVAMCLAALDPNRFERLVTVASAEASSPWVIGFNHIARQALLLDPGFPDDLGPGLAIARQVAHMTYRNEAGLLHRHGRGFFWEGVTGSKYDGTAPFGAPYRVQSYLAYQGNKLVCRFDGRSYISLLDAMDHHDFARDPGKPARCESWMGTEPGSSTSAYWDVDLGSPDRSFGLSRLTAKVMAVGVNSDQLFFAEHSRALCERLSALGKVARYEEISSVHGHDGFLMELDQIQPLLDQAMNWS